MTARDPQLAVDLNWRTIRYPVAVEPKVDGCRCGVVVDGGAHPYSRRGNEWHAVAPALADLSRFDGQEFDGEVVVGGTWGATNAAIHAKSVDASAVVFHAFDLPRHPGTYTERRAALLSMLATLPDGSNVRAVPMVVCHNEAEVRAEFARVVAAGGEGVVVKTLDGRYAAGRSGAWGKLKQQPTVDVFRGGRCVELLNGKVHRVRHDKVLTSSSTARA